MTQRPSYEELQEAVHQLERQTAKLKQSEEALRESEASYRAIVEAFDGLIYVCSQDCRIEFMNDGFIKRTGYDATGEYCYKALHGLDQVCPWCVNERVFKGEIVRWEIQSPKDMHWYYVVNSPIFHADGSISKQAMITDITERKQMENFLTAKREILEMVARGYPLQETLDTLSEKIETHVAGTLCAILMLDSAGTHLYHVSAPNLPKEYVTVIDGLPATPESHICARAACLGEQVIVEDMKLDPFWADKCEMSSDHGLCACWCVPVRDRTDKILGTFALYHRLPKLPSKWEMELVETAAYLAGIAIERKQWEAAIEQSERRYRSLFEESRDAIYITSRDGYFEDANEAALKLFGYSREEFVGRVNVSSLYAYPPQREDFQRQIESKGALTDYEVVLRRKDGTLMDCLLTATTRRSIEGYILGYEGIIRDVSDYKRAERDLRKSEQRYRHLFEDSPIGLLELDISPLHQTFRELTPVLKHKLEKRLEEDPESSSDLAALSRVVAANKAALELYQADSHQDLCPGLCTVFGPESREVLKQALVSISNNEPEFQGEAMIQTTTGMNRQISLRWSFIETEEEDSVRLLASVIDISHLKSLEREKSNITTMFAHDMKSSLVVIQGFVMRLLNRTLRIGDEKREQYLNIIRKEAAKLEFMVDDFLEFSRLRTGHLKMEFASTSLDRELQELLEAYQERAGQTGIRLKLVNLECLPVVDADARRLRRVFANLLDNAFKFSSRDGTITIQAMEADNTISIRFMDEGVGIAPEDMPYIFDPFHRGKDVAEYDGYGVGLAAVKTIVEAHGGQVLVDSERMCGSAFTVILPKQING